MPRPCNTTVTIDGQKFNALSTHFEVATRHDGSGQPAMGATACAINVVADIHDDQNVPFAVLKQLFELSHSMTRDKIKTMKLDFWKDDSAQDAICSFSFQGWISRFAIQGGDGTNHLLSLSLQPALSEKQFVEFSVGN